jgi:hypothetical protein
MSESEKIIDLRNKIKSDELAYHLDRKKEENEKNLLIYEINYLKKAITNSNALRFYYESLNYDLKEEINNEKKMTFNVWVLIVITNVLWLIYALNS